MAQPVQHCPCSREGTGWIPGVAAHFFSHGYISYSFNFTRCSIREKCTTSGWISAFDDGICPDVRSIFPEVMSNRAIQEVGVKLHTLIHMFNKP